MLSQLLASNTTLEAISAQETKDHQKYWTAAGRAAFVNLLKTGTKIMTVDLNFAREDLPEDESFVSEIDFYAGMKATEQQKEDAYYAVMQSCDPTQMF